MTEAVPESQDGFMEAANAYLTRLRQEGYSSRTIRDYKYSLERAMRTLAENGLELCSPTRMPESYIGVWSETMRGDPWLLRTLSVCLKSLGCPHTLSYSIPPRSRVRWLSPDQASKVMDTSLAMGPPYSTVVHLELELGFRRISVIRALVGDFACTPIYVRGKGHDYTIWPHPRTSSILLESMEWRERNDFTQFSSLVPARSRKLRNSVHPYSERGLDGILSKVITESGVKFSHHDLRRTFGRSLWKAGVRIETVSEMMGHQSIDQTREYLGINFDDMNEAMQKLYEYQTTPQIVLER